jgi:hypothetical protein
VALAPVEMITRRYVLDRYEFEPSAKMWLQLLADPPPSSTAPTFVVHGVEVVTKLWDEALKFTQDGTLDVVEARDLWAMASPDEETCPPLEASTLRLVLAQMHSSPNAYKFLIGKLGGEVRPGPFLRGLPAFELRKYGLVFPNQTQASTISLH